MFPTSDYLRIKLSHSLFPLRFHHRWQSLCFCMTKPVKMKCASRCAIDTPISSFYGAVVFMLMWTLGVNTRLQAGVCTWLKPHKKRNKYLGLEITSKVGWHERGGGFDLTVQISHQRSPLAMASTWIHLILVGTKQKSLLLYLCPTDKGQFEGPLTCTTGFIKELNLFPKSRNLSY